MMEHILAQYVRLDVPTVIANKFKGGIVMAMSVSNAIMNGL